MTKKCIKCGAGEPLVFWGSLNSCVGERYICYKENGEDSEKYLGIGACKTEEECNGHTIGIVFDLNGLDKVEGFYDKEENRRASSGA